MLLLTGLYLAGYLQWYGSQAKYRIQNQISNQYIASQEAKQAALEAQYKSDPYGGATPEETLKLFIEALEKKDYALASNYFIPEKRAQHKNDLTESAKVGGTAMMINGYRNGKITKKEVTSDNSFQLRLYQPNDDIPFVFSFIENPFTHKWLISEL